MRLSDALDLHNEGCISLVGGGGKSTLMLRLAKELASDSKRVVITTTTHILRKQGEAADFLLLDNNVAALNEALATHSVVCIASSSGTPCKLSAPAPELLEASRSLAHWVIAEADGSRKLPIKAPAPHEPVLLHDSLVIAVAGLSALGQPLSAICQRQELACQMLGVDEQTICTPDLLARLLTSKYGQYKDVDDPAQFRVVLNQADDPSAITQGEETAAQIKQYLPHCRVVLTALHDADCIKGVY